MKTLGLDIGTTTISAVVAEEHIILSSVTRHHDAFLPSQNPWERVQDPSKIRTLALQVLETLLAQYPDVQCIGVTGQMHGIVYLDDHGTPVSPLYTWQDGRGDLPYDSAMTYAQHLSRLTGYRLSSGFGLVTHFYNLKNGLVPPSAVVFCTIHDYMSMILAGGNAPCTEASDGASFGMFLVENGGYDLSALEKAGMDASMLPPLVPNPCIGMYQDRIPVFAAIGDNQASFLGVTGGKRDCMLVNVGTGGQFSVYSKDYLVCPGLETRPFPGGGYLIVGASLCSGRAYALMETFIRDTLQSIAGIQTQSVYDTMDRLLRSEKKPDNLPCTTPLFQGTREDPALRGSITNLDPGNFTIRHLIWSLLEGMAKELHGMYTAYTAHGGIPAKLMGSGNGLRKNIHLQACIADAFQQTLSISSYEEEAAVGAAIYAATAMLPE